MKKKKYYDARRIERARKRNKLRLQRFLIIVLEVAILAYLLVIAYHL